MRVARNSLGYRILLPIFMLVAGLTVALLLLVQRITQQVTEDYQRFTITASAGQVTTILELAAAELTAAKLGDNPVVAEAKKGAVREAIALFWSRNGLGGVIAAADGTAVFSTLDEASTRDVLAHRGAGYFTLSSGAGELHCLAQEFPLWGWTVTTADLALLRAGRAPGDWCSCSRCWRWGRSSWPPASFSSSGATCGAPWRRWSPPSTRSARCRRPASRSSTASAGR